MSNQIVISSGAKVRELEGVLTGTSGIVSSVPLGAANGVATLDSGGKVPVSQLPSSVVTYLGTWNAATNTPTLVNGTGDAGDMYICNVQGTVNFGAGPVTFAVGDWVLYGSGTWQKSNGQNGTVTSVAASITGSAIGLTGSPITTAGTLAFAFAGTNLQYVNGAGNLTTFPTLITSIGLSMPSAFSVANSPLTANGTIAVTGAGTTAQYIRGDGSLATFPTIATEAQRLITEVYNETGATLTKGTVVYINGGHGNLPTITKAIATGDATSAQTYGIVQTDITNNNNGYVVVIGSLGDLDTQAYANGTQLYLSSTTAGQWTDVKQYAPAHLVYVGIVVRSHPTQGVVEVRIQNGFEMDELHNVSAQSPLNNQGLFYNTSTSLWENKSIATALGYTPANDASVVHNTGNETIGGTKTFTDATKNNGGIFLQNASSNSLAGYMNLGGLTNGVKFTSGGGVSNTFTLPSATGYTFTFPNATGTIALTSDISYPVTSVFGRTGAVVATSGDYTTAQVTESGNLYFTDSRARLALSFVAGSGAYNSTTGVITIPTNNNQITNGSNYITLGSLSAGVGISYNNTTGVITNSAPDQTVSLTAGSGISVSGTYPSFTIASTITQYTDALARAAISSSATGLTYTNTTGVFSLTAGYSIPTTANQTNWTTAYNDSIISAAVTGTTTKTLTLNQQDGGTITASWTDINTDAVTSVFGRTGAVVAAEGDYSLTQLSDVTITTPTSSQLLQYNGTSWVNWTPNYITGNQTITLSGDVSGSGATSITTTIGALKVTNAMLAGSIDLTTKVTGLLPDGNISSAATWNAKQATITLTTTGTSGAATFSANTLNIPNYAPDLSGYVTLATTQTISGAKTFSTTLAIGTGATIANDITWTNDTGYGLKANDGTRYLSYTTAGGTILGSTGSAKTIIQGNGGNVGIGVTNPQSLLSVNGSARLIGTATSSVTLGFGTDNGVSGWSIGNGIIDNTHNFRLYDNTNAAVRLTVDASGNLGLAMTPDYGQLTILKNSTYTSQTTNGLYITSNTNAVAGYTALGIGTDDTYNIGYIQTSARGVNFTAKALSLQPNGGNVLIGTSTNDTYKLDVNGTGRFSGKLNVNVALSDTAGTFALAMLGDYAGLRTGTDGSFNVDVYKSGTGYINPFKIASTGAATFSSSIQSTSSLTTTNLGFTNTNASQAGFIANYTGTGALQVSFSTYNDTMNIYNETNAYAIVTFKPSSKAFIINPTNGGNVLIGTTTNVGEKLQVYGGIRTTALSDDWNVASMTIDYYAAVGTGRIASYFATGGSLAFYTNASGGTNTERMRITSGGNVGIGNDSPIAKLDVANTPTFSASGNTTILSTTNLSVAAGATFNTGGVWAASRQNNLITWNGSVSTTMDNGAVIAGQVAVNRHSFGAAGYTINPSQSGSNIRALAGLQVLQQTGGSYSGTITYGASMFIQGIYPTSAANVTFTNYYGLLINNLDEWGGVTLTNRWGIYQAGSSDANYLAGKLQVGSATAVSGSYKAEITGILYASSGLRTGNPTGGTAQTWKLGSAYAGTISSNYYVNVEINGTTYSLLASNAV